MKVHSLVLKIPIIEKEEGQIKRIIPIPDLVQNVYFSIILDHDYIIKYRDSYVLIDKETIKDCKTVAECKICERIQPSIKLLDSETCEATLFKRYTETKCKTSLFSLHKETFIPIFNGYIVMPVKPTKLDIDCESFLKHEIISKPSLLQENNCKVYNEFILYILKAPNNPCQPND